MVDLEFIRKCSNHEVLLQLLYALGSQGENFHKLKGPELAVSITRHRLVSCHPFCRVYAENVCLPYIFCIRHIFFLCFAWAAFVVIIEAKILGLFSRNNTPVYQYCRVREMYRYRYHCCPRYTGIPNGHHAWKLRSSLPILFKMCFLVKPWKYSEEIYINPSLLNWLRYSTAIPAHYIFKRHTQLTVPEHAV